ncbi:MAG TPA: TetR/AcrR family transcriptional regulator [Acidimicrobiales bacterium]|nr:TetR/AcrR family transcriptional regulator [Acidimicrobiales bacterium]
MGADRGSDPGVDVTRLGLHRDTHLTRVEIAAEALRCFDESATAPSIRHLATVLRVTPSAIYHHYLSRADIIQAAVDLVWDEAIARFLEAVPDPFAADPVEVIVTAAIVTRGTFTAHYQMAPFITVTRQSSAPLSAILALMSDVFERMGMDQDEAAAAFHIYASFTIGSVLFAATRRITDEQLLVDGAAGHPREQHSVKPTGRTDGQPTADSPTIEIQQAIGEIIDRSTVDLDRDAALFEEGLRQLVSRSKPADPRAPGPA